MASASAGWRAPSPTISNGLRAPSSNTERGRCWSADSGDSAGAVRGAPPGGASAAATSPGQSRCTGPGRPDEAECSAAATTAAADSAQSDADDLVIEANNAAWSSLWCSKPGVLAA